jgi:hypothetical protein
MMRREGRGGSKGGVDVVESIFGNYETRYIMCENGKSTSNAYLHSSTADLHLMAFTRL